MKKIVVMILMAFLSLSYAGQSRSQDTSVSEGVKRQIEILQSGSAKEKILAARSLGGMGAEAIPAVPYLIELLDSPERHRPLYKKVLNIVTIFGDFGPHVSGEAQKALSRIGMPAVTQLSNALLKHRRPGVRSSAAAVLGDIKDIESLDTLITALRDDSDPGVRMSSADALGRMADRWSLDSLSNALTALVDALDDRDPGVREKAADALGEMKARTAVPALIDMLEKYGKDSGATHALFKITRQQLGNDTEKWREWWNKNRMND